MVVRTRFAPSPTGSLHVGGVRTALFSWLYAKHHGGQFVLRIEDTDEARSTEASIQTILEGMNWLGLDFDEGPIFQTKRYSRYREVATLLLREGKAYRCTCSKERLETLREQCLAAHQKPRYDGQCRGKDLPETDSPFVIRFKNPTEGEVSFHDKVYGDIHVQNSELDDLILVRSDGNPTYNFAVVIDDWDMKISHVIRGDDHINNTPRQINLFQALNAPVPEFAHLPMILGDDGKRLSKRHGAVGVLEFKKAGFLPHALLNYLVRLGWSHGDQEIFSVEEMIALFDLNQVNRGVSSFNYDKLHWLNQHYQKSDDPHAVAQALAWYFEEAGVSLENGPALSEIVVVQAERCKTLAEMCSKSLYFYQDTLQFDEEAVQKQFTPSAREPLAHLLERFKSLTEWDRDAIQACINDTSASFDLKMGKVAQPLRVALTGGSNSPSIDVTVKLIGKDRVIKRLQEALALL